MTAPAVFAVAVTLLSQDSIVVKLLKEGNEAYAQRDKDGMPEKALQSYKKALVLDERRVEAYIRIVLVQFWIGTHQQDPEKLQAALRDGIEYAKIALSMDANCMAAHFWLAILYGLYGQSRGILQSLHMLDPMKAELDWVLKHDEAYEDAGAHRVYGRLYFKLPGVKGGDNEKAKTHLKRAIELAPKNLLNYLYLAEIHVAENRKEDAIGCLKALLDQPDDPRWRPECKEWREQAGAMLQDLEK
ncbi:MAG: tetratricopeptide repeat protein [Planctomycetes bacterium]|nr:tetratricopeptide repeat protein [Planctomycetota bacterium]